jgi:MarR family 2-MHQ and catechol resistance regulon transcriptional repressor
MPNRHKGSKREQRALDTYVKLRRASESLSGRLAAVFAAAGLTESQFGALEALYHLGPLCQKDLAHKILRTGGNLTLVIDNLEKRGLVRRERDPDDRRYSTVSLTTEGESLISAIFPEHAALVTEELHILTPAEQDELARLCRKIGLQLSDRS